MICPKCKNSETYVIDSRDLDDRSIRRRRECERCSHRFTTYERVEPIKLMVRKRNGHLEPFNREKIMVGLRLATQKRGFKERQLESIVDSIEQGLAEKGESPVMTTIIGNAVIKQLKILDGISYLRFTSVYKSFKSLKSFEREIMKINQEG